MLETTAPPTQTVDLSKYIEMKDGRAYVRGRRIWVSLLVNMQKAQGWSNQRLADEYGLSEAQVAAAILYYQEHQQEVDEQHARDLDESRAWFDEHGVTIEEFRAQRMPK